MRVGPNPLRYPKSTMLCGGKCRHNSIKNDYCGSKPGLSLPPLMLTLTLTLNPNPQDLTKPNLNPTDPTNLNDSSQTLVYRRNSHFRCYCGDIYRRKKFIHPKNYVTFTLFMVFHPVSCVITV